MDAAHSRVKKSIFMGAHIEPEARRRVAKKLRGTKTMRFIPFWNNRPASTSRDCSRTRAIAPFFGLRLGIISTFDTLLAPSVQSESSHPRRWNDLCLLRPHRIRDHLKPVHRTREVS